jgi:hypothetical protein
MPPEAFEGKSEVQSDVYSLGLTLYELLALRPAFEEKDRHKLIKQVTTTEPPRLERLNGHLPRDLVTIVHKAIDRALGIRVMAFSPDGRRLATLGAERAVQVWDIATQRMVVGLKGHTDIIWALAFSPDGNILASTSRDGTVKLWNLNVQAEAATLKGHTGQVSAVAFAPDGNVLATADSDGLIRLWRAGPFSQTDAATHSRPIAREPERRVAAPEQGFIRDWLILAPISLTDWQNEAGALDEESIPGEASLRPQAGDKVQVRGKELVWKQHRTGGSFLDFNAFLQGETTYSVTYAVCYVVSDRERRNLQLRIGSDGQAKVYLNGREVHTCREDRFAAVDDDTVGGLTLNAGTNVLLFKVAHEGAHLKGCIRFVDEDDKPVRGLQVRLKPE